MTALFVTPILRRFVPVALAIAAISATSAHADTVVYTSNLSNITTPAPSPNGKNFQLNYNGGTVVGITNTTWNGSQPGYNFVFDEGATAAAIASSSHLLGASNNGGGSAMKLDSAVVADPFASGQDHGAFLALDSVYQKSAIQITIGTIAGQVYTVSFDFAGTQQAGYKGSSTDWLTVGFGGAPTQDTVHLNVPEQGMSAWTPTTLTFTATSGSSILSFLASGTPSGADQQPAMTLLDNITVSQKTTTPTPEPGSLMLLSTGLVGLGGFVRSRFSKKS